MGDTAKSPPEKYVSIAEYFRLDDASIEKLEYDNGQVIAMAGGTVEHARISANLMRELGIRLNQKPCEAFGVDLRVKVPKLPSYSYPDISQSCVVKCKRTLRTQVFAA